MENEIQQVIRDFESAVTRIVLCTVREAPMPLGARRITSILKGTKSTFNIDYGIYSMPTYGLFSSMTRAFVDEIIQCLLEHELLEIRMISPDIGLPVLHITERGTAFLAGQENCATPFANRLADTDVILLDESGQELFEALRTLRAEFASAESVPPYVICHDSHLREMAHIRPATPEELLAIKGIGTKFVQNYGVRFLAVIAQASDTQKRHVSPETPDAPTRKAHDVEVIRKKHPNAYRPWTPQEDERLRRLHAIGMSIAELAQALGRQTGGIRSRLKTLGLSE